LLGAAFFLVEVLGLVVASSACPAAVLRFVMSFPSVAHVS
jgi:hypothetical protein